MFNSECAPHPLWLRSITIWKCDLTPNTCKANNLFDKHGDNDICIRRKLMSRRRHIRAMRSRSSTPLLRKCINPIPNRTSRLWLLWIDARKWAIERRSLIHKINRVGRTIPSRTRKGICIARTFIFRDEPNIFVYRVNDAVSVYQIKGNCNWYSCRSSDIQFVFCRRHSHASLLIRY